MPTDILKSIIKEVTIKLQEKNIITEETFEFTFDLFSSHRLKRNYKKKLIGDLGNYFHHRGQKLELMLTKWYN
ncbi:hypothetical protein [Malacoplasma iowae]|uniref:hypothetical protein n=1 Tax=Malacoplasma iowae TaxID=2116 RepID=UPI003872F305|nr:hypothetical protein QX181_03390 [Malacoplasma iowae]